MGIRKFKTFQDAEEALWEFSPDARYYEKVRNLFRLAARLHPQHNRRGIAKYLSVQIAADDSFQALS